MNIFFIMKLWLSVSVAQKKTSKKVLPSDVKEGRTVFIRCVIPPPVRAGSDRFDCDSFVSLFFSRPETLSEFKPIQEPVV